MAVSFVSTLACVCVGGMGITLFSLSLQDHQTLLDPKLKGKLTDPTVREFFIVLAICNSVVVSSHTHPKTPVDDPSLKESCGDNMATRLRRIKYEAESPDEAALVKVRQA